MFFHIISHVILSKCAIPRGTQDSLIAQSLKTHQQQKYSYISNSMFRSSIFVKYGVLWKNMNRNGIK